MCLKVAQPVKSTGRGGAFPLRNNTVLTSDLPLGCAEVVRSADLLSYTAEEGVRFFGEGKLLASDSFPGQDRTKLCLASKVGVGGVWVALRWVCWRG